MAATPEGTGAARWAVRETLRQRGWNVADFAREAGIDPGTASDFLAANRWPKPRTQGRIEAALGWPFGALARMAEGQSPELATQPDSVGRDLHDEAVRVSLDLGDAVEGLSPSEKEEVELAARLAALQKAREIRGR